MQEPRPRWTWGFVCGNAVTATLLGGVVDTLDTTGIPGALGDGIPFSSEPHVGPMRIIKSVPYHNGAMRLVYDTNREQAS